MAIDLPVSFKKYAILSLIIAAVIFLIINFLIVLTPIRVAICAAVFSFFSFIIALSQASKIKKRRYHEDDKGYVAKNKDEKKEKISGFKYAFKPLIGFLLPLFLVLFNFAEDSIYYGVSLASLALVLLSFKGLVNEHNLLTSSKLPQLNKRGGDENA